MSRIIASPSSIMVSLLGSFTFRMLLLSLFSCVLAMPISQCSGNHTTTLSSGTTHYGRGTWFYPGLGNCGDWSDNNSPIIAISKQIYGSGDNCNQWVHITNTENGRSAYGQVKDSCPSCAPDSLDMSPAVFEQLASLDVGNIAIEWTYMNKAWSPP